MGKLTNEKQCLFRRFADTDLGLKQ